VNAAQALKQWLTGVSNGQTALEAAQRKLDDWNASPPKSASAAEHRAWIATRRDLQDDVDAEVAALAIAKEEAERLKKAAREEEIDAQGKEAERAAREAAKLVTVIDSEARSLAAKLTRLAELNDEVEAFNKVRGSRPGITNGERRVREVPEKHFPTVYETLTVWVHPETGHRPVEYREVDGEMRPKDGAYVRTTEKVVSRNAYTRPAEIPGGWFKDGFKLLSARGEKLFPAR
jgi:hypothetical protein